MSLNRDKETSDPPTNLRESLAYPMSLNRERDRSVPPTKPQKKDKLSLPTLLRIELEPLATLIRPSLPILLKIELELLATLIRLSLPILLRIELELLVTLIRPSQPMLLRIELELPAINISPSSRRERLAQREMFVKLMYLNRESAKPIHPPIERERLVLQELMLTSEECLQPISWEALEYHLDLTTLSPRLSRKMLRKMLRKLSNRKKHLSHINLVSPWQTHSLREHPLE